MVLVFWSKFVVVMVLNDFIYDFKCVDGYFEYGFYWNFGYCLIFVCDVSNIFCFEFFVLEVFLQYLYCLLEGENYEERIWISMVDEVFYVDRV